MNKISGKLERVAQVWAGLAIMAFGSSALVYLCLGRRTVTSSDFWEIYETCLNHSWLQAALTNYNYHLLFFPSPIWLADLRIFHGNQELIFLAGMILFFCAVTLLLLPLWHDKTLGLTAKLAGTLVVIVGNFWMGRASMTTIGGFLCMYSLAIGGAVFAFLWLPAMRSESPQSWQAYLIVLASAFVASFSFGIGLAVWPTLLLLGWGLRLPGRFLLLLLAGGFSAAVLYVFLPVTTDVVSTETVLLVVGATLQKIASEGLRYLCMLLGAPFLYTETAWHSLPISDELKATSLLSLSCGALGLVFAGLAVVPRLMRRDLSQSRLELIALGLVIFNLLAMVIIVVGRASTFAVIPSELSTGRYVFWSSLFWMGLLLVAIQRTQSKKWLRWAVFLVAFAVPVAVFPLQYTLGPAFRYENYLAECGATSLINGVRDEQLTTSVLFYKAEQVYRLAAQMRARRLDMFADGLQDWIGLRETSLFAGRHEPENLKGECHVVGLLRCEDGAPAAKVTGWSLKQGDRKPKTLIIIDQAGVVCGVARSWTMNKHFSRIFYSGKFSKNEFIGYIRNYDPLVEYTVRSADDGMLSDEKLLVNRPTTPL